MNACIVGPLRLDEVHRVVGGPLVEQLRHRHEAQLRVSRRLAEVGLADGVEDRQALRAQRGQARGEVGGRPLGVVDVALRVGVEARKRLGAVADRQEPGAEHAGLRVDDVLEGLHRRPLAGFGRRA